MERRFFIELAKRIFGDQLIEIYEGDCLLGVPEQTFAYRHRFVVVLDRVGVGEILRLRGLTAELPGCFAYPISESAFERYPLHGLTHLVFRRAVLGQRPIGVADFTGEAFREGVRHGVVQIHHLIRRFLTEPQDPWRHLWADRLLDWLLETLDIGVLRPLHYLRSGETEGLPSFGDRRLRQLLLSRLEGGTQWQEARRARVADPKAATALLLDIQALTESCLPELAADRPPLYEPDGGREIEAGEVGALAEDLRNRLADNLRYMTLFGSRARGEAAADADTDLFAVVGAIDGTVLEEARGLMSENPGTTVYLLSQAGVEGYPHYRYYSLHRDCRPLVGRLCRPAPLTAKDVDQDIRHIAAMVSRSSREYSMRGVYPMKVVGHLKWQAKKLELICSRLWPALSGEPTLESHEASLAQLETWIESPTSPMLELLRAPSEVQARIRRDLIRGEGRRVEELLFAADTFAQKRLELMDPRPAIAGEPEPWSEPEPRAEPEPAVRPGTPTEVCS